MGRHGLSPGVGISSCSEGTVQLLFAGEIVDRDHGRAVDRWINSLPVPAR
jgi:hypothetical protein